MTFIGIHQPEDFRTVTRAHVLAWRKTLEEKSLAGATIRRKLAALASLFEHLCESNSATHNPVKGKRDRAILSTLLYHGLRQATFTHRCSEVFKEAQYHR